MEDDWEDRRAARRSSRQAFQDDEEEYDPFNRSAFRSRNNYDDDSAQNDDSNQDHEEAERKRQEEVQQREREEAERKRQEEVEQERRKKEADRLQREKEEEEAAAKKRQKQPGQKRKGLGGLSKEKKRKLKDLIMQKAAEEMRAEAKRRQEEKENHLKTVVGALNIDGLDQNALVSRVTDLLKRVNQLEEEKYEWELKLHKQDEEINDLNIKVNDVKGKFVKPVLKKVARADLRISSVGKKNPPSIASFRGQLKSTGQSKYALEEKDKDDEASKLDWREQLKTKGADGMLEVVE